MVTGFRVEETAVAVTVEVSIQEARIIKEKWMTLSKEIADSKGQGMRRVRVSIDRLMEFDKFMNTVLPKTIKTDDEVHNELFKLEGSDLASYEIEI